MSVACVFTKVIIVIIIIINIVVTTSSGHNHRHAHGRHHDVCMLLQQEHTSAVAEVIRYVSGCQYHCW